MRLGVPGFTHDTGPEPMQELRRIIGARTRARDRKALAAQQWIHHNLEYAGSTSSHQS